jgi:cytochrome P450/NADPH-cytochrome P450 reductase
MRFKLDPSLYATISPRAYADTHLPVNEPVPLLGILANRIELQEVATREQIATLAQHDKDEKERTALEASPAMTHAMESKFSRRASRCSIFWTNIRPARRLSKSFLI